MFALEKAPLGAQDPKLKQNWLNKVALTNEIPCRRFMLEIFLIPPFLPPDRTFKPRTGI
jgi:hypothetical protein